ncbi:DNA gyrase subunit A [Mobiluncus curtisii]|uniref:DNA gyrase subunit A n=2 Tax=Mobiluncus curtisii TaxID=2051 RepID=D6ZJV4_MOBCV|nr:DNA gyrase subunit A [Mobiluncus curtisii]ADI67003.1 DNA gyrase, A subunit [Mobiluncus curtisii ATCC 43063]EFL93487.1 DNA gyrase, A subunit [Mobiluncus curtisii subsp. curtisii ATCC 35241]NMW43766.1 DNA gyrase subunit A [Mobiluncus curtisii]NMW48287.1 DNA gyrase subunit A [Mobiluncus curtisii]NMW99114.1 DNA gyrase subunit A [Mobiluncus curtisii]
MADNQDNNDSEVEEIIHSDAPVITEAESTRVMQVDLEKEMKKSYMDYAMSVIVGRALPDVRDGLKPVHRRVIYTMYDGGYRPNGGYSKCMRVVGDVLGHFHPHGDSSVYDALARLVQPWSMRYPLVAGQGNFGSPGNLGPAAPRYTECKMATLAMEMVRDIDEDTVDFMDNYDGRSQEPTVLPSRIPNLLINGSEGIAVGMATRIPPHNLREVADAAQWYLQNPEATREELLAACLQRIKGPDFPTGATILGRRGIEETYRTGRGSITQRAVVNVEELNGRTCLVATELPYQVNPDNLQVKIAQLVKDGQLQGIADIRDETSDRAGTRIVVVLKRDAVPKVVLNNLYKRTQLQDSFPANMLALVDGVPRTLSIDGFIHYWIAHQVDVIKRRTAFRLAKAQERLHILQGYLAALDALDEVIALIRRSPTAEDARVGLMDFLKVDEVQADAILALQLRRLAALERQKILDEHAELEAKVADFKDILARPERQRSIVSEELGEITDKWGDERKTTIVPFDGEMSMEDLIPEEDVVVTITRGGYAKRTRVDAYRSQHRGGKGIKGASLREEDQVEHFFTTSSHDWLLFFTNFGRVYRAKAYEIPEGGRDSKGQHVANLLAFQPDERIAQVLQVSSFADKDYLVLATRLGFVKKTRLTDYDTNRTGGLIAIKLREDSAGEADQLVSACLADATDDLILVSRHGQSLRFNACDEQLRPMGRATSGVTGMRFRADDELLTMDVVRPEADLFVVTEGGYAKRTALSEYRVQGRGGLGIKVANLVEARGDLVGALVTEEDSEVLVIMAGGKIVRSRVDEVSRTGRNTQGVIFSRADEGDKVIAITLNVDNDPQLED